MESLLLINCAIKSLKMYCVHLVLWATEDLTCCPLISYSSMSLEWHNRCCLGNQDKGQDKTAERHYLRHFIIVDPGGHFFSINVQGQGNNRVIENSLMDQGTSLWLICWWSECQWLGMTDSAFRLNNMMTDMSNKSTMGTLMTMNISQANHVSATNLAGIDERMHLQE